MNHLLDTNVISELRKSGSSASRAVRNWVAGMAPESLFLSVITVMEIDIGVGRVERRDPQQGKRLRAWLDERVLLAFDLRILPVDLPVARWAARSHVPDPRPERDALIAATAAVHGMVLATRNTRDFSAMPVQLFDPWSP
ncbi:PIN domain-containing protein [Nakamurella sp. YIM 132087]|uniref:Ribonuclease VapC n=1 Tax=Nakamurella alba TaxID=2665158 RepID=A0A7K1FFP7_9ACTN|nr:type II toxin-antitoxin system VapC family toxin [Nakamurella alba]MTD12896.1 PIN domain-containing protein [Nakamurella alba]